MRLRTLGVGCLLVLAWQASALAQSVDNPRVVTVSPDGTGADYSSLSAAIGSISDASASNRYVVLVYPGIYTGINNSIVVWKSYVSLRGVVRDATIIKGKNQYVTEAGLVIFPNVVGVEVQNITFDGSAQQETFGDNQNGAVVVNGADVTFENVVIRNNPADFSNAFVLTSDTYNSTTATTRVGNVALKHCVIEGGVWVADNNWTIEDTTINAVSDNGPDYLFGLILYAQEWVDYPGDVAIHNSRITARATVYGTGDLAAVWLDSTSPQKLTITGSTLHNDGLAGVSAAVYKEAGDTTTVDVDNSVLITETGTVESGEYLGVYAEEEQSGVTSIRNCAFRSLGSGGTRADVDNDSSQSDVVVSSSVRSSASDTGPVSTGDLRQGSFSTDLVVPLTSPTLGPVNGQVWIDTVNNKLCYRSGGSTRCVTGS